MSLAVPGGIHSNPSIFDRCGGVGITPISHGPKIVGVKTKVSPYQLQ